MGKPLKISEEAAVQMPMKTVASLIAMVAIGTWAYFGIIETQNRVTTQLEIMGKEWVDPWEKPLHDIYQEYPCFSPMPSLAIHCANINSVFGVSPFTDIKKIWDQNEK